MKSARRALDSCRLVSMVTEARIWRVARLVLGRNRAAIVAREGAEDTEESAHTETRRHGGARRSTPRLLASVCALHRSLRALTVLTVLATRTQRRCHRTRTHVRPC